jgi:glucose-1-phosphatase
MQRQPGLSPQIKVVIFDLGGVILRTEDPNPRTELARQFGKTRGEMEDIVFNSPVAQQAERGLVSPEEVWSAIARRLNLSEEEIPQVRRAFFAGDQVDFELIDLIQKLREHYRTVLLSNTWIIDLPRFLREDLQIPDTFDFVISSAQSRTAKPDPEIFHITMEMVNARPEECVFVDDNAANITAAAAMGIHAVRFSNASQARGDLMKLVSLSDAGMD